MHSIHSEQINVEEITLDKLLKISDVQKLKLISEGLAKLMRYNFEKSQSSFQNNKKAEASTFSQKGKATQSLLQSCNERIKNLEAKQKERANKNDQDALSYYSSKINKTDNIDKLKELSAFFGDSMKKSFENSQKSWDNQERGLAKTFSETGKVHKFLLEESNKKIKLLEERQKENFNTSVSQLKENMVKMLHEQPNDEIFEELNINEENFSELREAARIYGDKMCKTLEKSQQYWKAGDKAKAKQYADIGNKYKFKMEKCNALAGINALALKNKDRERNELDLHGLYENEAVEVFEKKVRLLKKNNERCLVVIVGKGIHSKGQPVLKEAIMERANYLGLMVTEDLPNEGCLLCEF